MSQEGYKSQSLDSQIDLRYIFRTLKKNAVFILMCVCLTGMFSYVILDHSLKDTYAVSVHLLRLIESILLIQLRELQDGLSVVRRR